MSAGRGLTYVLLLVFAFVAVYPLYWMVISAFKTTPELFERPWAFPSHFSLRNFGTALSQGHIGLYFLNSVKVTVLAVGIMILVGALAAYGIVRKGSSWARPLLFFFLAGQMLPAQVVIIPLFLELDWLNLVNSHFALICVYIASGLPFTIFLLQGFLRGIPSELYDAAVMDGLRETRIFTDLAIPLIRPGLAAALIFQSLWVWNEFLLAIIVLRDQLRFTLTIGVYQAVIGWVPRYDLAFSALTMVTIPIIIVFVINQRHFVRGLVEGSVKG